VVEKRKKIMNIEINGVTLQADFMDAGFMEILEPALSQVRDELQKVKTQPRGLVAASYDALNKTMDKFFNTVFGPDTSEQLFDGSRNVMIRMEALAKIDQLAKESRKQFNDFSNKYSQRQQKNGFNSMQGYKPRQKRT
jgi:hypothetical protein